MTWWPSGARGRPQTILVAIMLVVSAVDRPCLAQTASPCDELFAPAMPTFPRIPVCAFPGAYRDSSLVFPNRCVGSFQGPLPDSIEARARAITVRFRRSRRAEARRDFGGYRIYRVINRPDSTMMMLVRRFSRQVGDERTWSFSVVDTATLQFKCRGQVVHDSIVTFVDPDSNGNWVKVCRIREPQEGIDGRCVSRFDSVFVLRPPPGPHDGFLTWYAVTYEGKNTSLDGNYADLFVPDTTGQIGPCGVPGDPRTCPNLNHKLENITAAPVEPTGGPTPDLERVAVVPNPYRAREAWDPVGANELHFINLPENAVIRVFTVSGDLITEIHHADPVHDFERWNLKNPKGSDIASGIYVYRVEAKSFSFQDRFVVIR